MQAQTSPALVLMRAGEEDGRTLFSADLYLGRSLQASVYHTRSTMLGWLEDVSVELRHAVAYALDQIAASPEALLRSIPLNSLSAFAPDRMCGQKRSRHRWPSSKDICSGGHLAKGSQGHHRDLADSPYSLR